MTNMGQKLRITLHTPTVLNHPCDTDIKIGKKMNGQNIEYRNKPTHTWTPDLDIDTKAIHWEKDSLFNERC